MTPGWQVVAVRDQNGRSYLSTPATTLKVQVGPAQLQITVRQTGPRVPGLLTVVFTADGSILPLPGSTVFVLAR